MDELPSSPRWLERLPKFYLPLLLVLIAAYAFTPLTGGDDFWAHAAIGRWIAEHGAVPRHTLFLWTEKGPWISNAWLCDLFFYQLMRLGGAFYGPFFANLLTVVFCAVPFLLVWNLWRRDNKLHSLMPLIYLPAIWCCSTRFHPRPELISNLFLALVYLFLQDWPRGKTFPWGRAAGLMLMFAIWPNFHGGVAFGLLILWATTLIDLFKYRRLAAPLVGLSLLAPVLVTLCNPRFLTYWRVLAPINSFTFSHIQEWQPFWQKPAMSLSGAIVEGLLWALAAFLFARQKDKRWAHLAWIVIMGAAFLKARRNLWASAFTSLFVISCNAGPLETQSLFTAWRKLTAGKTGEPVEGEIPTPMRAIMRLGTVLCLILSILVTIPSDWYPIKAVSEKLPEPISEHVLNHTKGRIFNDYEFSSYYEWHFHGRRDIYIDLNNAYPDALMKEYFDVLTDTPAGYRERVLREKDIRVVVLRPRTKTKPGESENENGDAGLHLMARYLNKTPGWKRTYQAKDGSVWVRTQAPA